MMSQENVEVVRRAFEAATRKPKPDFATMNALFDPDHEYVSRIEALEGGVRRGAGGYRDWLLEAGESFDWETRLEDVKAIDDDRVLAVTPTTIHSRSGVSLEQRMGALVTVRNGRIMRTALYTSPEEALEAARLSE